jgi:23S rRNA (uracil1939-C5)-methyltransferase
VAGDLRAGDVLPVTIEKGVYRGLGLARHAGGVVFVRRAIPGDRLRVRVERVRSGYAWAVAEETLAPGPGRRPPPCPYFARCGGCAYQGLDYAAQLALKQAVVRETFARGGVAWEAEIPVRASPEEGWRTRASFHLAGGPGGWALGLHEEASHTVVDLPRCLQLSEAANRTLDALRSALVERPAIARRVAHVDLAESATGDRVVVCLDGALEAGDAPRLAGLVDAAPWLTGAGYGLGRGPRGRFVALRGEPHVYATVLGIRLRSHIRSFFQANRFLIEDLAGAVVGAVPPRGPVLDLYSGVGLFALPLAASGASVTAVEWNAAAVEDARANARAAGLEEVRVRCTDVLTALGTVQPRAGETVILDPPRSGAGADVVRAVAVRRPAFVVYVSCDPPTLARDLKTFMALGYRPDSVQAFDVFPDTFHLETVVRLAG